MNPTDSSDQVLIKAFDYLVRAHHLGPGESRGQGTLIKGVWCESNQASLVYKKCPLCIAWSVLNLSIPHCQVTHDRLRSAYGPRWRRHVRRTIAAVARSRLLSTG